MKWSAPDSEILRITAGSNLHGLNIPGQDDTDEMGITVEPPELVIGLYRFEQETFRTQPEGVRSSPGDIDRVIYSLRKWSALAAKGNPTILLPLFAPISFVIKHSEAGARLRRRSRAFVSRQAGARFQGYLNAQRERLIGQRGGAPKRPELTEMYGYDTKFAMHMVRLAFQGIELMETGQLTLPMPSGQRALCLAIRQGEMSKQDSLSLVGSLEVELAKAIEKSQLPPRPHIGKINQLLIQIYEEHWDYYRRVGRLMESRLTDD